MAPDGAYPVFGANGIIGRYNQFNHADPQLLITCRGATCGSVNVSQPNSWITGNAMVVRPKNETIDLRYLEYYFRGGIDITSAITGAAQPQITRTNLEPLTIQYPTSLVEQRRIVEVLDKAFAGIATATANAQINLINARALFESYRSAAFQRNATRPQPSDSAYPVRKLGELCHIARGGSPRPIQDYLTDAPDGINWIKISDATASDKYIEFTKEKIRPEGLKKSRLVRPGDFILSNSMSFGRPYIMKTTGCIHDGWLVLSDKSGLFDHDFLYHFLGSNAAYRQFDGLAAGSTIRNLNSELVRTVVVPVPPLDEQRRIVVGLEAMRSRTKEVESVFHAKLAALTELKQSLLQKAFAGELI